MKTISGTATVGPDGALTMRVPPDVSQGEHEVTLTVPDGSQDGVSALPFDLPTFEIDAWPDGLSLRREDLYGDWGR